jgi:hypothetical protein
VSLVSAVSHYCNIDVAVFVFVSTGSTARAVKANMSAGKEPQKTAAAALEDVDDDASDLSDDLEVCFSSMQLEQKSRCCLTPRTQQLAIADACSTCWGLRSRRSDPLICFGTGFLASWEGDL